MVSRNSIYALPRDGTYHINGDHDHVSRYKSYYQKDKLGESKHPRFNISAKQDLLLPDSRIGAFQPPLFSTIIHGLLLY